MTAVIVVCMLGIVLIILFRRNNKRLANNLETIKLHEQICDYMQLLLDDYEQYNTPINDNEWNLLMGELKKLRKNHINS